MSDNLQTTERLSTGLPTIALAMLLGICALQFQPDLNAPVWAGGELLIFLPICLWLFYLLPHRRGFLAFFMGYLWALLFAHLYLQQQLAEDLSGKDFLVEGVVRGIPDTAGKSMRFNFEVTEYLPVNQPDKPQKDSMPSQLRLSWYNRRLGIRAGDQWRLLVRLKAPHGMQNPGGFDYEKWLYQQGIHATGYIRKSPDNQFLRRAGPGIDGIRQQLMQHISTVPDTSYQGLLQALTLGYKSAISPQQWQVMRRTGTSHLMAISGLHIGLVAGLVFFVMRRLAPAWLIKTISAPQFAAIVSLLAAGFYALLAGFSVPTQRAFVMLLVVMLAVLLKRPAFSLNTLSLALIAVLVMDPVSVLSVGFWLSFLAVLIISQVSSARITSFTGGMKSWRQGVRIQWLIALGMLPLSVLLFQQGSIISPVANMLVIPLVGLMVVPLALMASVLSILSADAGSWLFSQAAQILGLIWQLLEWMSLIPLSYWQKAAVPIMYGLLALCGVFLLLMPRGFPLRVSGAILLLPLVFYQPPRPAYGEFWLTVLDVGQGLSLLIQTRDKALLYDTGAKFSDRFDIGQRVVVPYLQYIGVERLDVLMISHADNDHAGGAASILKQLEVVSLLGDTSSVKGYESYVQSAMPCAMGEQWQWSGVHFEIIHPDRQYRKSNNRSCVLKIWNPQYSLLLAGDIERKVEQHLVSQAGDKLAANVLVVPHHGSNTSSSAAWLDRVKPDLAIVSAGYRNRFGHPTQAVMQRYNQYGSRLLNTAFEGAIQLRFTGQNGDPGSTSQPLAVSQRKVAVHYWNHRF